MENDELTGQVDKELGKLHSKLKEELMEVNEVKGLDEDVYKNTVLVEQATQGLEQTSRKTKWKWLLEYVKWVVLACIVVGILLLILLRPLLKK